MRRPPPRRYFPDEESALADRLGKAWEKTKKKQREHCGMVCKDCRTGKTYTTSTIGLEAFCLPQLAPCELGDKQISMWHTHPYVDDDGDGRNDYVGERFSPPDEWWADVTDLPFWLITPDGTIGVWPPRPPYPGEDDIGWPYYKDDEDE